MRDFTDQQRRYNEISKHLQSVSLPYTVRFEYLKKGIRIRGTWYPILKMEWIDGEPLHVYIERNLYQPQALRSLILQWKEMLGVLSRNRIAHGDLQHGNVIVNNSQLRLIDYDGMYVPGLRGLGSHEEGHRNYQHPDRTGQYFESSLDNFSAWVIFISLSALAIEPDLWKKLNGGDEALLFRRADFERPANSNAIRLLDQHRKHELRALASQIRSLLSLPLRNIPGLDGSTNINTVAITSPPAPASGSVLPDWLASHVQVATTATDSLFRDTPPAATVNSADWIIEQIISQNPPPITEHETLGFERLLLVFCMSIVIGAAITPLVATFLVSLFAWAAAISICITMVHIYVRRHANAELVVRKAGLEQMTVKETNAINLLETTVRQYADDRQHLNVPLLALDLKYRGIATILADTLRASSIVHLNNTARISYDRQAMENLESRRIYAVRDQWNQEDRHLRSQLDALSQAEIATIASLRNDIRDRHVRWRLESAKIQQASLHGIWQSLKTRLHNANVLTAADIDGRINHVSGIGPAKRSELRRWRDEIMNSACSTAPSPTASDLQTITTRYAQDKLNLQNQIDAASTKCEQGCASISAQYRTERNQLGDRTRTAVKVYESQVKAAQTDSDRNKRDIKAEFQQLERIVSSKRLEVDKRINEIQQALFQKRVELCKLSRELERFRNISFFRYLKRIVGLSS